MGHSKVDEICDYILEEMLDYGAILSAQQIGIYWILPGSAGRRISANVAEPSPC